MRQGMRRFIKKTALCGRVNVKECEKFIKEL